MPTKKTRCSKNKKERIKTDKVIILINVCEASISPGVAMGSKEKRNDGKSPERKRNEENETSLCCRNDTR